MQNQRELGLTDQQKTYMRTEIGKTSARFNDLQWQLHDAMEVLHETMKANQVNEQQALAQLDRVLETEREIKRLHMELAIKIKNNLTPEQQQKLLSLRRVREPGGRGMGPGHGPGDGPGVRRPGGPGSGPGRRTAATSTTRLLRQSHVQTSPRDPTTCSGLAGFPFQVRSEFRLVGCSGPLDLCPVSASTQPPASAGSSATWRSRPQFRNNSSRRAFLESLAVIH